MFKLIFNRSLIRHCDSVTHSITGIYRQQFAIESII